MKKLKSIAISLLWKLLVWRHGEQGAEYWAWEETPYPCGPPFWYQIWWGYKWALLPKGWAGKSPATKSEEALTRESLDHP